METSPFQITLIDNYNSSSISNFTALIDGTTYYSNLTTGILTTPYNNTQEIGLNITLGALNYLSKTYGNYNITNDLNANISYSQARHNISAFVAPANTTAIVNFTITSDQGGEWNTTSGVLLAFSDWNVSTNFTIAADGYQTGVTWVSDSTSDDGHQFNLYSKNSFNINFYDELNNSLLDWQAVTLELISDVFGSNYTTTNGTLFIDLLTPADYILRYKSSGYETRFNYVSLIEGSFNVLDLYLLQSASSNNVTATVITTLNEDLEGALINVQKYDILTNTYKTVEKVETNFEGEAIIHTTTDEFYKFVVEYGGSTVLSTSPTYILEDTITLVVDIGGDPTTDFFSVQGIDFTFTFSNATNQFRYVYNDVDSVSSQNCLKVYTRHTITGDILTNTTCSTSNSGTLIVNIVEVNGTTYVGQVFATIDGKEYILDSIVHSFQETSGFGNESLLIIVFLMIVFATISIWNPFISVLLTPVPLIFGAVMGIIPLGTSLVLGVIVATGFFALFIGGKS